MEICLRTVDVVVATAAAACALVVIIIVDNALTHWVRARAGVRGKIVIKCFGVLSVACY